jgi:hypothetical protein
MLPSRALFTVGYLPLCQVVFRTKKITTRTMRLHHSPDASTIPAFKLMCFVCIISFSGRIINCTSFWVEYMQPSSVVFTYEDPPMFKQFMWVKRCSGHWINNTFSTNFFSNLQKWYHTFLPYTWRHNTHNSLLSIMTFCSMALSRSTLSKNTLSIAKLLITTLSITRLSIKTFIMRYTDNDP